MNVFCTSFDPTYRTFARVLEKSIKRHSPAAVWCHQTMRHPRPVRGIVRHASVNTGKLERWNEFVQGISEPTICCDADMLCLGPLEDAFDAEFDVAYTVRPGLRRFQAGAVFVRPTEAAKAWFFDWTMLNDSLLDDAERMDAMIAQHGGVNQASLALMTERSSNGVLLAALPCEVWNSCSQTWGTFGPETRLLHLTGRLRRAAMTGRVPAKGGPYGDMVPMVTAWLEHR